jgi:hypothetical protein
MLLLNLLLDELKLGENIRIRDVAVGMQRSQILQTLFMPVVVDQPARRLGKEEDTRGESDGGDDLQSQAVSSH